MAEQDCALPVEEVHRLVAFIQADPSNAPGAIEQLTEAFSRLIHWQAYKLHQPEHFEDLVQEGYVALLQSLYKFDASRGVKFSTYATTSIRNQMLKYMASERGHIIGKHRKRLDPYTQPIRQRADEKPTSLDEIAGDDSCERVVVERLFYRRLEEKIIPALDSLSERQQQAVLLRFVDDQRPSEIASCMGVSRPRVTALVQEGLGRMRLYMTVAA
jgi:RNA polymerase sigma factor (sigma-70 family)